MHSVAMTLQTILRSVFALTLAACGGGVEVAPPRAESAPDRVSPEPSPSSAVAKQPAAPAASAKCGERAERAPLTLSIATKRDDHYIEEELTTGDARIDRELASIRDELRDACPGCEVARCVPSINDGQVFAGHCARLSDDGAKDLQTKLTWSMDVVAFKPFVFVVHDGQYRAASPADLFLPGREELPALAPLKATWKQPHGVYLGHGHMKAARGSDGIALTEALRGELRCNVRASLGDRPKVTYARPPGPACEPPPPDGPPLEVREVKSEKVWSEHKFQTLRWPTVNVRVVDAAMKAYVEQELRFMREASVEGLDCSVSSSAASRVPRADWLDNLCYHQTECSVVTNDGEALSIRCRTFGNVGWISETTTFNFVRFRSGWKQVTIDDVVDPYDLQLRSWDPSVSLCSYFNTPTNLARVPEATLFVIGEEALTILRKDGYACHEVPYDEIAPLARCALAPRAKATARP